MGEIKDIGKRIGGIGFQSRREKERRDRLRKRVGGREGEKDFQEAELAHQEAPPGPCRGRP